MIIGLDDYLSIKGCKPKISLFNSNGEFKKHGFCYRFYNQVRLFDQNFVKANGKSIRSIDHTVNQ